MNMDKESEREIIKINVYKYMYININVYIFLHIYIHMENYIHMYIYIYIFSYGLQEPGQKEPGQISRILRMVRNMICCYEIHSLFAICFFFALLFFFQGTRNDEVNPRFHDA